MLSARLVIIGQRPGQTMIINIHPGVMAADSEVLMILVELLLVVARIEGSGSSYTGYNVYGGYLGEHPADIIGKSRGIICINGLLYMWVGPGSYPDGFNESRLYTSTNHAATWVINDSWAFVKSDGIIMPGFLQFGKNFANARDNYAYIYAQRYVSDTSQIPGKIDLMRVDKTQILNRASYEFFKGFDLPGNPLWTSDLNLRQPVFEDASGVGRGLGVSVMYNPGLDRYILIVEHGNFAVGNIGIFEAPEPWGPWKTIAYESGFGTGHVAQKSFYWNISPKWLSSDGKDFVLIFTGIDELDSWNTVEASFTINNIGETSPYPQSNFITGITYNWASHKSLAPGSDGWATTWADDGNLYSIWGNGGGFGGTNVNGRVSLGVARIEGQGSYLSWF